MGSGSDYVSIGLKAKYSFYSCIVFFMIANPETFRLTQMLFGSFVTLANGGCPTPAGLFFHTLLFFLVLLGLMLFPRDV